MSTETKTPQTDTPRTDAAEPAESSHVTADFARTLERELAASEAACAVMQEALEPFAMAFQHMHDANYTLPLHALKRAYAALSTNAGQSLLDEVAALRAQLTALRERQTNVAQWLREVNYCSLCNGRAQAQTAIAALERSEP